MTGSRRVFVVDDEPVIADTLQAILKQWGFEAFCFTDPMMALKAAALTPPQVLLTDVIMPKLNGVEFAILFKALCPECQILLMSGHNLADGLLQEAENRGHAFRILAKPFQPDVLRELISTEAQT